MRGISFRRTFIAVQTSENLKYLHERKIVSIYYERIAWFVGAFCKTNGREAAEAKLLLLQRQFWFSRAVLASFRAFHCSKRPWQSTCIRTGLCGLRAVKVGLSPFPSSHQRLQFCSLFSFLHTRTWISVLNSIFNNIDGIFYHQTGRAGLCKSIANSFFARRVCEQQNGSLVGFLAFDKLPNFCFTESASSISLPIALISWLKLFATADHWLAPLRSTSCTISSNASRSMIK